MSFPKYPAYKDSGVEWIGKIPAGWSIKPFWTLFRRVKRNDHAEKELLSVYRDYGVIPKSSRDDNFNKPSDDLAAYQLVKKNDLVINKMKAWQGSCAVSNFEGIVSPAYFVFSSISNNFGKFLHYLLRCDLYISYYYSISKGVRPNQWDLDPETHSRMPVILPSLSEQQAIASFLDRECGKIDALIAEQERLIALLAEKRQAVISHAVTKGLNPNAPMKDSGIPWIGMVPEGWTLRPLKSFVKFVGGATPSKDNLLFWNGDIPWVSPKDMKSYHIFDTEDHITKAALSASATRLVPTGNLLIVVRSGILQRTIPVAINSIPVTLNQDMKCMIPQKEICVPDFLFWLIHGFSQKLLPIWSKQGATVESLELEYMQKTLIPVPAIPEQRKIIQFIQHHCKSFNNLIVASSTAISLLKERRAALISAGVTGKIDVRTQSKAFAA